MTPNQATTDRNHPNGCQYALRRDAGYWALVFEGREAILQHELGALYVACLLLNPPKEPLHAVALALKARETAGKPAGADEVLEERSMGLEDATAVRALWRRQSELERVLKDRHEIEPVKAEALRELEEITEHLRTSPWLSRHGAERCVRAVAMAIQRFHARLVRAVDTEGRPDTVLRDFALHLYDYLLLPSGRSCERAWRMLACVPNGCFTYLPPKGVVWEVSSLGSRVHSPRSTVHSPRSAVHSPRAAGHSLKSQVPSLESEGRGARGPKSEVRSPKFEGRPAAAGYLARFVCAGVALALLVTGCASRPLKGGRAVTARKAAGVIEQSVVQGENASQATKQDQETVKVRTYTVPAGSRVEASQEPGAAAAQTASGSHGSEPATLNPQPSTAFTLSAPMPVVEREETRARTELGAAQKDTARELGARLSSLKGIVWVGVALFVFGLASLVYPPLKVIVASVTTSAALMLGGVALMVLPTMVVGNELLILGVVALVVGGWFLAHRHGQLRGTVAASSASTGDKVVNGEQGAGTK